MNRHGSGAKSGLTIIVSLVAGLICTASWVAADETQPGFPPLNWGANADEIMVALGPPAFVAESILMYQTAVVTDSGTIPADLTLWFDDDLLYYASFALPVAPINRLEADFEAISRALVVTFDLPSSQAAEPGSFTTEVWNLDTLGIEHTLILEPGRVDHIVTFTVNE